jgi:clan AA aspartic protease (TIGR02281 family)
MMTMTRRLLLLATVLSLLVWGRAPAADKAATAATADKPAKADAADPAKALEAKKLELRGSWYVTPAEVDLAKGMVELRKRKAAMDSVDRQFRSIDQKIKYAKALIAHHELEIKKLNQELTQTQIAARQNQLIAKINLFAGQIKEANQFKQENEEKMNKAYDEARQNYLDFALQLGAQTDKAVQEYADLAKDKEVTDAVEAVGAKLNRKIALGPSRPFESNLAVLQKYRDDIMAGTIDLETENNVHWVPVLLNGKTRQRMVLDSGAGLVSIPSDLAEALGLMPTNDDPTIRLQLADGQIVEAKLMKLQSVQVGVFEVKDVECAVLPKTLIAAQPLLGGTFLRHFTYKIDSDKGHLSLVKIKDASDKAADNKKPEEKPQEKKKPEEKKAEDNKKPGAK